MEYVSGFFETSILWCALFIFGVVILIFWPESKEKRESPLDVLHKKFVEGTLNVEQYQERKAILEQDRKK